MDIIAAHPFTSTFLLLVLLFGIFTAVWKLFWAIKQLRVDRQRKREVLSAEAAKRLEYQLEMQDPWYPSHDDWMDEESRRFSLILKSRDPILYIQTKLQHWMEYQELRTLPVLAIRKGQPNRYALADVSRSWSKNLGVATLAPNELRALSYRPGEIKRTQPHTFTFDNGRRMEEYVIPPEPSNTVAGPIPSTFAG